MLGRRSLQRELFRPDHALLEHVGADAFHPMLARSGRELFKDADFADLYQVDFGRPSVPPSQLSVLLLVRTLASIFAQPRPIGLAPPSRYLGSLARQKATSRPGF